MAAAASKRSTEALDLHETALEVGHLQAIFASIQLQAVEMLGSANEPEKFEAYFHAIEALSEKGQRQADELEQRIDAAQRREVHHG